MNAGTLTLSSSGNTFTATVTAIPGFNTVGVTLVSPTGGGFPMTNMTSGVNPSTWQYQWAAPGPGPGPAPAPPSGNWTATAMLQGTGTCSGSTSVP